MLSGTQPWSNRNTLIKEGKGNCDNKSTQLQRKCQGKQYWFFFTSQCTDLSDKRIEMSKPTDSNTLILREKHPHYLQMLECVHSNVYQVDECILSYSENLKKIFMWSIFSSYCLPHTDFTLRHLSRVRQKGSPLQKESASGPVNKRCFTPHLGEVTHWSQPPQVIANYLASLQWLRGAFFLKWACYTPGK